MFKLERMTEEISRCRLIMSAAALGLLLVDDLGDATFAGGPFAIVAAHFLFASTVAFAAERARLPPRLLVMMPWTDAAFAVALAVTTTAVRSPFFVFAAFAVVSAALSGRSRDALAVTVGCITVYVLAGLWDDRTAASLAVMRAVCLAILGYLVVRLATRRLDLESDLHARQVALERARLARQLHDGSAALLAAVDLRLEANRELLRAGHHDEVLADLERLRERVRSEHEELRGLSRRLANVDPPRSSVSCIETKAPRVQVDIRCESSADLIEALLEILREGLRNVGRHAHATSATLRVRGEGPRISLQVTDDGVGYPHGAAPPWSIASRVAELGGLLDIGESDGAGARLSISLPRS